MPLPGRASVPEGRPIEKERIVRATHKTFLTGLAAALALGLAAPAFADHGRQRGWDRDDEHYKHEKQHWKQHKHRHVHIHEYYYAPAPVYYPPAVAYPAYPRRPQVVVTVPPIVVDF